MIRTQNKAAKVPMNETVENSSVKNPENIKGTAGTFRFKFKKTALMTFATR